MKNRNFECKNGNDVKGIRAYIEEKLAIKKNHIINLEKEKRLPKDPILAQFQLMQLFQ